MPVLTSVPAMLLAWLWKSAHRPSPLSATGYESLLPPAVAEEGMWLASVAVPVCRSRRKTFNVQLVWVCPATTSAPELRKRT